MSWIQSLVLAGAALTSVMLCCGCGTDGSPRSSHFEHDHQTAAHWPDDLADAASKIRQRLLLLSSQPSDWSTLQSEITEIVAWVPEIAADEDLSEAGWLPIDERAQSLANSLRSSSGELEAGQRARILELCSLIDHSLAKIAMHQQGTDHFIER